ncbi:hypothetical protein DYB25_013298 [Aphanomyces astaci]|uniref:Serine carboxypeptidase S28 n=1 Tax=Aphanomyces astaci TaxID=112090 RepID=A0A397AUS8_APHAT|nr:hypothetical protein DYB25_013298 [Aphanomyces astaci]
MARAFALGIVASAAIAATTPLSILQNRVRLTDKLHQFKDASTKVNWYDEQTLDHTDASNGKVWKQPYYFNDQYYGGAGSPVFLHIDGTDPMAALAVTTPQLFMNELAKKHKALMVSLGHRFYGKSQPLADLSLASLKFLSADQALGDLVKFQDFFRTKQNLTASSKWVAFGSSYPGMLAAWLKLKYSSRFAGAVASSAPLHTKIDMFEFGDTISEALQYFGGDACVNTITKAMTEVHRLVASTKVEDADTLTTLFNPCSEFKNDDDRALFELAIFNPFQGPAQDNDFADTNLASVCESFASLPGTPVEKLSKFIGNTGGDKCTSSAWEKNVESVIDEAIGDHSVNRAWLYQTCTEFGFAQTTATGHGAFAPLKYATVDSIHTKRCAAVFNITDNDTRVAATLKTYGGLKINVENVIFPIGTIDPWNGLALNNKSGIVNPKSEVVEILGASHHSDIISSRPSDSVHLAWAHQRIESAVDRFLRHQSTRKGW